MATTGTNELLVSNPHFVSGHGTVDTGSPITSEGLYWLAKGTCWDNEWELMVDLLVNVRTTPQEVIASIYLTALEYGAGHTVPEAVQDLLTSLSDYYKSLESREDTLGEPGIEDLSRLRSLVRIKSNQ